MSLPESSSDYEKITSISAELEERKLHLDELLEEWEKLSQTLSETEEKIVANGEGSVRKVEISTNVSGKIIVKIS